jgi:ethanolamine utilization protein EutP
MKKRVMVVGPTGCGKTALVNALNNYTGPLKRTQNIIYGENTIDVPGAYIENASMYCHLIATAQTASHVLLLVDQSRVIEVYPPGFAKPFTCPVLGVVTKTDLMPEKAQLCLRQLKRIGISEPYFWVCVSDGTGVAALKQHLFGEQGAEG